MYPENSDAAGSVAESRKLVARARRGVKKRPAPADRTRLLPEPFGAAHRAARSVISFGCMESLDTVLHFIAAVSATLSAVGAIVAAVGVVMVNGKLNRLTGRVDANQNAIAAHVNAPGLHHGR